MTFKNKKGLMIDKNKIEKGTSTVCKQASHMQFRLILAITGNSIKDAEL